MSRYFFLLLALFSLKINAVEQTIFIPLIHKVEERTTGQMLVQACTFHAETFKDGPAIIQYRALDGKPHTQEVYAQNGTFLTRDQSGKFFLDVSGLGYGEPIKVMVIPCDHKGNPRSALAAASTLIPFPLQAIDAHGQKINLQTVSPDGKSFHVSLSGFPANEKLIVKSVSCYEKVNFTVETDKNGCIQYGYHPAVEGKREGFFELTVCSNSTEPLSIRHFWGPKAFTPAGQYARAVQEFLNQS